MTTFKSRLHIVVDVYTMVVRVRRLIAPERLLVLRQSVPFLASDFKYILRRHVGMIFAQLWSVVYHEAHVACPAADLKLLLITLTHFFYFL